MTLAETLGIERPIIQAPMAGVQGSELAIAVCNAGGLGSLPCAMLDAETMAAEISRIKGQTAQPFNVNFFCHTPPVIDAARELRWREALKPYFEELGLNVDEIKPGPGRQPFSAEIADVLAEFKPPVVSFHFGLPAPELVDRVKSWGRKCWCRRQLLTRLCGWNREVPMSLLLKAPKLAGIAVVFSLTI